MNFTGSNIGSIIYGEGEIVLHPNRKRETVKVIHCGDRPIQVGSHYHFFEVNKVLKFDRKKAFGMHLDILSGTAIRFEPGDESTVTLVEYSGNKKLIGFNQLTMGKIEDEQIKQEAFKKAHERGFLFSNEVTDHEI